MEAAASVVGLLVAAAKISSVLKEFIEGSINAPDIVLMAHYEVHDFGFVLSKLQPTISGVQPVNLSRASLIDMDHLLHTLAECKLHVLTTGG